MIITLQTLIYFRESLLHALDRILRPYYNKFTLTFGRSGEVSEDEEPDDQVFSEFDEEKGVVFYPPVYLQRYAAVSDCLMDERWCGKLDKVVDLGYHDMSFIKYLKEVSGIRCILGVDIESIPLRCSSDLMGCDDYGPKRESPLQVTLFQGNAADPDYRLIGCDAVIAIEMIEHMLPQDLDRLVHTVFGFIKPWVAIFTTPNGDFNVLFKAMEKNGFRRWDHFFEWSREQFHDWCSNIVTRYPEYTVSCKGIGPGPPGTLHLGCCSQMAVFISKDYHKQQDLNLDSLALVANAPSPYNVSELLCTWDSSVALNEANMICPPDNVESFTELYSERQSCVSILLASQVDKKSQCNIDTDTLLRETVLSLEAFAQHDKTSQCNLDTEAAKNYMMFDYEQMCFDVVVPRRKMDNRVYMIEDVNSRLNCTTLQVKKFSKTTQNLIAKNKVDSLVHTREVVDEIRHLTKMLNFNKDSINQPLENGVHIWYNINWGDNAPYWNQYYKVVREYNPPYETKSEESRITELISDEINRLIDNQFDEDFSVDMNRLEIPIERLMGVVAHITNDVEKVKDLLEWDGYEVVDNVVIHSRLVLDNASTLGTQEDDWPDMDTYSDWDSTDVRSTTLSDGSTMVQDYHARCLRRALDQKVRKLRTMLTADEDITTELDRVVCKLMKLALRTSSRRHSPPPTRWMQCKLLDLLTLTEKAIERRKRYFIENYPLKSIGYDDPSEKSVEMLALEKIREDDTALKIVNKYRHLVQTEKTGVEGSRAKYSFIDMELEDDLSATSAEFMKDYEYIDRHSPSLYDPEPTLTDMALFDPDNERTKIERTQAWLEDDLEVVSYPQQDLNFDNEISSGDTEHSTSLTRYYKKSYKKYKTKKQSFELKCVICKKSHSKVVIREHKNEKKVKDKTSKTKVIKKVSKKKSSYNNLFKDSSYKHGSVDYRNYRVKSRKHEYNSSQPTASKPIPASLIELCHPELMIQDNFGIYKEHIINFTRDDVEYNQLSGGVSATEKSLLIDIVMDDIQETIAMKRTIGTDAEGDPMGYENETLIRSVSNTAINDDHFFDKHDVGIENDQTIFLNDINEPSTSKGIRHVSMDVQCGPDASAPNYSILSTTTSITRMPSIFTAGIKIGDSSTDTKMDSIDSYTDTKLEKKSTDCCTSTDNDEGNFKTIAARERTVGIKIKESIPNMIETFECSTMTPERESTMIQKLEPIRRQGSTKIPRPESPLYKRQESPRQELRSKLLQRKESSRQETSIKQKLESPSPKQESPSDRLGRLGTNLKQRQESHSRQQGSSSIQQESPSRQQGSSAIQQELPSRQEESSAIQQESPSRQQASSAIEQESPSRQQGSSAIQEELPNRQQESSAIQQETPVQRQETPAMQRPESPIQSQETPANHRQESPMRGQVIQRQESPIIKHESTKMHRQESPVRKPESTEIHRQESPVRKHESTEIQRQDSPRREHELTTREQEVTIMRTSHVVQGVDQTLTGEPESDRTNASSPFHTDIETKCLKSIPSGMKIDSGSEFCGSFSSIPKSMANCLDINLKLISSGTKDVAVSRKLTRYVRPKLCCGGVQVHSYRDIQTSEDVMYQGEWQNPRPKVLTKRKIYNPATVKRITDSALKKKVSSKEKIPVKSIVKKDIKSLQKLPPTRQIKPTKMKSNLEKKECTHSSIPKCVAKVNRPMRNVTKVPSKLTMGSATSKNSKSAFVVKKPQNTGVSSTKDEQKTKINLNKEYLPYYLRRHALKPPTKEDNNLNLSLDSAKSNVCKKPKTPKPLVRSKTEEIKQELLKFQNKVPKQNYIVLRNEVEKTSSANDGQPAKATADSGRRRGASKRTLSPQSQNSSTCSSPNSIATVRAVSIRTKNVTSRRHSTSSYKTSTANSGSENTTPNRNKKYTKRSKSAKMSDEKTFDNKENIPQTSRQSNIATKASDKNTKGAFLGQQKEVFIAQLKETPPLQSTANKKPKSNINIPITDLIEKSSKNSVVSKKSSFKSDDWTADNDNKMQAASTEISNMVLVIQPQRTHHDHLPESAASNTVNTRLITEWIDNSSITINESQTNSIKAAMRMLVEETLDFISEPYENNCSIDSETVILSRENLSPAGLNLNFSPISFKTVITNENYSLQSDLEQAVNRSFDTTLDDSVLSLTDTRLTVTDFDLMSFKSITSVSKFSEYLSADSSQGKLPIQTLNSSSVKDIYERKDQPFAPIPQNNAGAIAIQAFSGFSINSEPIAGDKADAINFIDSETGSMAVDVTRQANSEELFISGRSSDSFESCLIDEDSVVPSWLFQIISQQQAAEDDENRPQAHIIPLPMPDEPLFDVNGNSVEGIGLGAGAGDGRGIHSDQSQDSSGRGTSLSSSATSSGPQSEAILIDPFVAQFEGGVALLHESENSSIVVVGVNDEDDEFANIQGAAPTAPDSQSLSHGESTRRNPRPQAAVGSDVDADVSSLETDVPDSS